MKCLILQFKGAGIFDPRKSKDKVCDLNGRWKRNSFTTIQIPVGTLSKRHISNLLHVLMGERPSPSIRASLIEPIKEIVALAEKTRVKIDSTKDKSGKYIQEVKTVRKSVVNAWPTALHEIKLKGKNEYLKGSTLTWEVLRVFFDGTEFFSEFRNLVEGILGKDALSNRLEHVIERLSHHRDKTRSFADKCLSGGKTQFGKILKGEKYTSSKYFNSLYDSRDMRLRLTVTKGVEKIARLDGRIYVPVTDEVLEKVRRGPGTATFLEGGVVFIEGVEDFSENLIFGTQEPVE